MRKTLATLLLGAAMLPAAAMVPGAARADQVTLNWALWDENLTAYYKPLIDAYEAKHPDVTIKMTDLGSANYDQMVMTQLSGGGSDLDVITVKDIPNYAQLIGTKQLVDLTTDMKTPVDPKPYGGLIEALTVNNNLYALPFRADFWVAYYNKDLLDKAGLPVPTNDMTWAQFDDLARKATSGFGNNKVYGEHFHVWRSTVELPAIQSGEHTLIARDYSFLKPWYERALKLQDDGTVMPYSQLVTTKTHYSGPFFNSQIALLPMGTWFIGTQIAKVASGESTAKNWGIVSFPHPDGVAAGSTAAQVTSIGVAANSKHKDAALDFISFVAGPEGAKIIAQTGTIPALRDADTIKTIAATKGFPTDANSAAALQTTKAYLELPVDPKAPDIDLVLNRAHDAIMTGSETIDQGIADMNKGVTAILDRK